MKDRSIGLYEDHFRMPEWMWILLLISLPLTIQFSGIFELFPPTGWVDPMIYIGYFLDPHAQIQNLGAYYFSQRIPFIALGSFFYEVLSAPYAHLALGILFQCIAIFSLYTIGRRALNRAAGVISAWWLGTNPLWIASISSGYVDGPAIALSLCAIALFLAAKEQKHTGRRVLYNALSGSAVAAVLALHPLPALFTAISLLTILLTNQRSTPPMLGTILSGATGGLLTLILMAAYSHAIGGPFFFLLNDHHPINNAIAGRALPFNRPVETWMPQAFRLAMPIVLLASAIPCIVRVKRYEFIDRTPIAYAAIITLLASIAFVFAWDFGLGGLMAQSWFYTSYFLIAQSLLALFILTALMVSCKYRPYQAITTLALLAAVQTGILLNHEKIVKVSENLGEKYVWFSIIVAICVLLCAILSRFNRVAMILVVAVPSVIGIFNGDTRFIFAEKDRVPFRTFFELAIEVRQVVDQNDLRGRRVAVWANRYDYPSNDVQTNEHATYQFFFANAAVPLTIYDSIAGLWLWDKGMLNLAMPNLTPVNEAWLSVPQVPTSVIVLCTLANNCDRGRETLERAGISTTIRARTQIWKQGLNPVSVLILDYTFDQ